jgi:DMSO/TMAO reductase YedYZ molybdopterin-dependent catalytic subunit
MRSRLIVALAVMGLTLTLFAFACAGSDDITGMSTTTIADRPVPSTILVSPNDLEPVVQATLPSEIPGYLGVDPAAGLTMTGTPVEVDIESYRLKVTGEVDNELSLAYDEIRLLPKMTASPLLECPGYFVDQATWSGVPLTVILDMAEVHSDAYRLVLRAADGYSARIALDVALAPDNFLAYEVDGETLPALHGFPLRAVFPERAGGEWVKWLVEIVVE